MNEQQTPQTEKAPVKLHWGRLFVAVLLVAGFFVIRAMLRPPIEYKALNYAAVLTNPDLYSGELARREAVMIDRIESPDKENTWFLVSEPDHDDHVWIVCGPLPASEASRLEAATRIFIRRSASANARWASRPDTAPIISSSGSWTGCRKRCGPAISPTRRISSPSPPGTMIFVTTSPRETA